jgi:hypothetical protein
MSNSYFKTSYHNCPKHQYLQQPQQTNTNSQANYNSATPSSFPQLGGLPFPAPQAGGYVPNFSNPQANWNVSANANNGYYAQTPYDAPNLRNSYYTGGGQPMPFPMPQFVPNPYGGNSTYGQATYGESYGQPNQSLAQGGASYASGYAGYGKEGALGNGYAGQYLVEQQNQKGSAPLGDYASSYGGGGYGQSNLQEELPYFDFPQGYLPQLKDAVMPPPLPTELPKAYGVNETAAFWGDPHIVDADRADKKNDKATSFDVAEAGLYNIVEDKGLQFNAKFEKFPQWGPTVATEAGINLNGAKVLVSADGTATVNGKKLLDGETVTLKDGSKITDSGKGIKISTNPTSGEYDIELTSVDSGQKKPDGSPLHYIDSKVSTREKGVGSDAVAPKGILGEGFDDDGLERKALKLGGADKYTVDKLIAENKQPYPMPKMSLGGGGYYLPELPPFPPLK